ncbi:MAG: murF [Gammaproteobacteria bacterium]|jgi:UDP-N-acetylmuramoyl-tripeptide--D-alanyl-D-alanine ligase|nr:murF [Gammaproteobacteria bacterium]
MIKMSLAELNQILNYPPINSNDEFHGISIDTRTLLPHNLFVAIKGERFDGHDFIVEAAKKGASAALVERPPNNISLPQITVPDTLEALGKLSLHWRKRFLLPIIGITGSNGKTTLKNMISSILRTACHNNPAQVLATEGNFNNHIGLPLTLLRLSKQHRYAVIEMGMNHFGEIAYLTHLAKPQVAIINNAAEAHLEGLQDVAGVARAKGEIFLGLQENGTAILNSDDAHFTYWHSLIDHHPYLSFGLKNKADVTAVIKENQSIQLHTPQGKIDVTLPLLGTHNIMNALAATAATLALDLDLMTIKQGLEQVTPAPGRMQQYILSSGTYIINDTYNANPFSLQAAVNTLASLPGIRIVVLGDMKELGSNEMQLHHSAGENIRAAGIHHLFTFGHLSSATALAFGQNAQHFTEYQELVTALRPYLKSGVTILVKGSRSMQMERIIAEIMPDMYLEQTH